MIDAALGQMVWHLNQHFRRTLQLDEDAVVLSNLLDQDGTLVPIVTNKLVLFLVAAERDSTAHRNPEIRNWSPAGTLHRSEPVFLNLLVMCAANFSGVNYGESLKFLSSAILFFQANSVLDRSNCPELDPRLERLILSIENLDINTLNSLWSIHSGRYLPSVMYRVRMVMLDPDQADYRIPLITQADVGVGL